MRVSSQSTTILQVAADEDADPVICLPRTHYSGFPIPLPGATCVEGPRATLERPLPVDSQSVLNGELSWDFFPHQLPEYVRSDWTNLQEPLPVEPQSVAIPVDLFEFKKSEWRSGPVVLLPLPVSTNAKSVD